MGSSSLGEHGIFSLCFLFCSAGICHACKNVYVYGGVYDILEGLYTPINATCEGYVVYEHRYSPTHNTYTRRLYGRWGISPHKERTPNMYEYGPATEVPYDVEWSSDLTVTCIDASIRLLKPDNSSLLFAGVDISSVLTDNNSSTCVTLPRSGIEPGSEYRIEFAIPTFGETKLLVTGGGFLCDVTSSSSSDNQQCGIQRNMPLAILPSSNADPKPACTRSGYYKKYSYQTQSTTDGVTTCDFRTSCETTGGCSGVLLTIKYRDFLTENITLCDVLPIWDRG